MFFVLLLLAIPALAQPSGDVPMPTLTGDTSTRVVVYLAPDARQGASGSRQDPVSSFTPAMARLKELTANKTGRVACALVFLPGRYKLTEPFIQFTKDYIVTGTSGQRQLELSFIGEGMVVLDASAIVVPTGHGVITPSGSGIEIRNLRIANSSEFGIRLGTGSRRSTNVLLTNVAIDTTYCHGILIGDASSSLADTTALVRCSITNTNQMNVRGSTGQFGSALKMFGARAVNVIDCSIGRNWGEAICINNSSRVRVSNCTVYDNWAPGVYCDVGSDVVVRNSVFRSNRDTTVFVAGRRGMVGILLSTEGWSGSPTELRSGDIDIVNNTFINMAGCLDIWEGAVSAFQRQVIERVRFAHNTCVGMWTTKGNTSTAFVNLVYSSPFPTNRQIRNILVANNIFSVDPALVAPSRWVRLPAEAVPAMTYPSNYWSASVPGIASTFGNIIAPSLPFAEPASWLPEVTASLKGRVPRLSWVAIDAGGRERAPDTTNVGAYEDVLASSVSSDVVQPPISQWSVVGTSALICAPGRRVHALVYALNGRLLSSADIDATDCQPLSWMNYQPVLVELR